jgi:hypothetical protein
VFEGDVVKKVALQVLKRLGGLERYADALSVRAEQCSALTGLFFI